MRPIHYLLATALVAGGILFAGCQSSRDIVSQSLADDHPALMQTIARPPVSPSALVIAPSPYGPTEVPRVDPVPILPKMDAQYKERKMPAGYEQYSKPTTRAADRPQLPASPETDQ